MKEIIELVQSLQSKKTAYKSKIRAIEALTKLNVIKRVISLWEISLFE